MLEQTDPETAPLADRWFDDYDETAPDRRGDADAGSARQIRTRYLIAILGAATIFMLAVTCIAVFVR